MTMGRNGSDKNGSTRQRRIGARLRYLLRHVPGRGNVSLLRNAYRTFLLLSAAVLIDLAFPVQSTPDLPLLEEGSVAPEDIIAEETFEVYKSDAELSQERAEAAAAVPPIFDHRPEIADSSFANAAAFLNSAGAASSLGGEVERQAAVRQVLEQYRISPSQALIDVLSSQEFREAASAGIERAFDRLLRPGVVASSDLGGAATIVLRSNGDQQRLERESLRTKQQFLEEAGAAAPAGFDVPEQRQYTNLLIRFAQPTIELNRDATEAVRAQARLAVDQVKYEVLEGERIVAAHERVGSEEVEKLSAYADQRERSGGQPALGTQLGGLLYNVLLLILFGVVLRFFRPQIWESERSLGLLWVLLLAVGGAAALITWSDWPAQLIPVAFAALIVASLYDGLLALVAVFVLVGLVATRPPLIGMSVLFPTIVGGAAAALSGRVVPRRAHTWTVAAVIAAAYALAAVSLGLLGRLGLESVLEASFWGTVNAVGCTLLAAGVLPITESFTRITTDQTLLELADLNRPLLRRLALEAPGTYAHSINVANIAEAAAREIGANSLLVRVGVYYHDIGKVKKPHYFVENQPRGRNPHDKLKPATSAAIVRDHVKEGLELAEDGRVPDAVRAFIPEHHGTQLIGFFRDKAKELDPDADLDPSDYRYPGPKPQSRETAIVLLADSVESAARVLQDPTEESITELVDRIVRYKTDEGQLDEAPLTLREISIVKQQFVKVLAGMYHSRLDYPLQNNHAPHVEEQAGSGSA